MRLILESAAEDALQNRKLRQYYGNGLFKCTKLACLDYRIGFETLSEKELHETTAHNRKHKCTNTFCEMSHIGFIDEKTLTEHQTLCKRPEPVSKTGKLQHTIVSSISDTDQDWKNYSTLYNSVLFGDVDLFQTLLTHGVYKNASKDQQFELLSTILEGQEIEILRTLFLSPQIKETKRGNNSLLEERFNKVFDYKEYPAIRPLYFECTPLEISVFHNNELAVELLLDSEAHLGIDFYGLPHFMACLIGSSCRLLGLLLDYRNKTWELPLIYKGLGILHVAIASGNEHLVTFLVSRDPQLINQKVECNTNFRNWNRGMNVLHLSIFHGHCEIMTRLFEYGVDEMINVKDGDGRTPFGYIFYFGHWKDYEKIKKIKKNQRSLNSMVQLLISKGARPEKRLLDARFSREAQYLSEYSLKLMIDCGLDLDDKTRVLSSHLRNACLQRNNGQISKLIKLGANPYLSGRGCSVGSLVGFINWARKYPDLVPPRR